MKLRYGLDAPLVPIMFIGVGIVTLVNLDFNHQYVESIVSLIFGLSMLTSGMIFIHTSLWGKFAIWQTILSKLKINGNEKVLDLGCGSGAVLILFAKLLTKGGSADGVDLWLSRDQSNNSVAKTQTNIDYNHVGDRTTLITADMADLPVDDHDYDYVVSSYAFHNIKPASKRYQALKEAVRVLKPGGRLIIVDMENKFKEYKSILEQTGLSNVVVTRTGINGWWGGPWMGSFVISGIK